MPKCHQLTNWESHTAPHTHFFWLVARRPRPRPRRWRWRRKEDREKRASRREERTRLPQPPARKLDHQTRGVAWVQPARPIYSIELQWQYIGGRKRIIGNHQVSSSSSIRGTDRAILAFQCNRRWAVFTEKWTLPSPKEYLFVCLFLPHSIDVRTLTARRMAMAPTFCFVSFHSWNQQTCSTSAYHFLTTATEDIPITFHCFAGKFSSIHNINALPRCIQLVLVTRPSQVKVSILIFFQLINRTKLAANENF